MFRSEEACRHEQDSDNGMAAAGRKDEVGPLLERGSLVEALDRNLALVVTSFLRSPQTTLLRASSRRCRGLFVRNCRADNSTTMYVEEGTGVLVEPDDECLAEIPKANVHSPLRCWTVLCAYTFLLQQRFRLGNAKFAEEETPALSDREFALAAVQHDGFALSFVHYRFKWDYEVCYEAVTRRGVALQYVDESLRSDPKLVLSAVTQRGIALQHADEKLRRNFRIVNTAVNEDPRAYAFVHPTLKRNPRVLRTLARAEARPRRFT